MPAAHDGGGATVDHRVEEFVTILHALLPELRGRFGICSLGLFGSYVRGEAGPDSDLDVLADDHVRLDAGAGADPRGGMNHGRRVDHRTAVVRLRASHEAHHQVRYTDEALVAAVELSDRYLTDRRLPD